MMNSEPLRQASNDSVEVIALRARVADLESTVEDLNQELRLKQLEGENEQERSDCLEIMLKKLGEKDDTTELLLSELRDENLALSERLSTMQDSLLDKDHLFRNMRERCEELEDTIRELKKHSPAPYLDQSQDTEDLKEELLRARERYEEVELELSSRSNLFQQRLAVVEKERDDLLNTLTVERSKSSYYSVDIECKQSELIDKEHQLREVMGMVGAIYPLFERNLQEVEYQIDSKLQHMDARLAGSSDQLYELTFNCAPEELEETRVIPISRGMLERTLRETQHALQDAINTHEHDEQQIQRLVEDMHNIREEKHSLTSAIQELERMNFSLRNSKASNNNSISAVEVSDLKARLCAVEGRAEKAAAEHAKLYAQHVRVIAYLESECSRLRGLGDHFRAMNVKLMSDLKKAKLYGMKCRGLEYRVTILAENEKTLFNKVQVSEQALLERNEEFIQMIRDKEASDMSRQHKYEQELTECTEQLEELQRKLRDANNGYNMVADKLRAAEQEAKAELHSLKLKIDHFEHENTLQLRHNEELDFELKSCREELRQRELLLAQNEMKLTLLTQESFASTANYERTVRDLTAELDEKLMKIQILDQSVTHMRTKVVEMEANLLTRDEEITMKLIQRGDLESEMQHFRDVLHQRSVENTELRQNNLVLDNEVTTLRIHLKSLEERYQELTEVNLKQASERASKSEAALRQITEELSYAKTQLITQDELLNASRNSLEEVEASLQRLQAEHMVLQTSEQVARACNETLTEECDSARNQVQELAVQLSAANQKNWATESELNIVVDQNQSYKHQIMMVEKKYNEIKTQMVAYETAETQHAEELQEIATILSPIEEIFDNNSSASFTPYGRNGNMDRDIFASPVVTQLQVRNGKQSTHMYTSKLNEWISNVKAKSSASVSTVSSLQQKLRDQMASNELISKQHDLLKVRLDKTEADKQELMAKQVLSEKQLLEWKGASNKLQLVINKWEDHTTRNQQSIREMVIAFGETLQAVTSKVTNELDSARLRDAHVVVSEFKEALNILVVRDDLATDLVVMDGAGEGDSLEEYVASFFSRSENLLLLLSQFVDAYAAEKRGFHQSSEELRLDFEKERSLLHEDIDELKAQLRDVREENETLYNQLSVASDENQHHTVEIISLKQTNKDLSERTMQVDEQLKETLLLNKELADSIKDAESIQEELQGEIKGLHTELDRRDQTVKSLQDQLGSVRKRITETDLQFEKMSSSVQRLRAEKEALENVRQSLEAELDRSRAEYVAYMDKFNPSRMEDRGYVFELEKLLAALSSTADQIEDIFGASNATAAELNISLSDALALSTSLDGSKHEDRLFDAQKRVEVCVARLARIRTKCREEGRSRKLLERQQHSLSDEVKKLLKMSETSQNQIQDYEHRCIDLERSIDERDQEIRALNSQLAHAKAEDNELSKKCVEYEGTIEQLKRENIRLVEDMQYKGSEVIRITRSLESCELTVSRLQVELNTVKLDYQHVLLESDQRAQQLRIATDNHQKTLSALEQVELGLTRERNARNDMDAKMQLLEGEVGQAARNKLVQLTSELDRCKEDNRALNHLKFVHEDRIATLEQDVQLSQQQVASLNMRIDMILKERSSYAEEVADTKRKIQAAKDGYELEKTLRIRSEAAIDALKRAQGEDKRKMNLEGLVTIRNNETESLHLIAEEEKRALRIKIQELKMDCDEKELMRQHEVSDKKKMEKDIEHLQSLLAKRTTELSNSTSYSSAFRKEGRTARKQVHEIVSQITELVNTTSLELQLGFAESHAMHTDFEGNDPASMKLNEALGLPGLAEMTQKMRELLLKYVAEYNRMKIQLQQRSESESDRETLRTQVNTLLEQRTTLINQHHEEKKALQQQLLRLKNDDGEIQKLLAQISALESTLRKEKERKERAIMELKDVRAEVDRLTGNSLAVRDKTDELGDEAAALHEQVQRLSGENNMLHLELDKVNAHRLALKETVDQMDRKLRHAGDPISPATGVDSHERHGKRTGPHEHGDQHGHQAWAVARYQARARAMEELANIYRQGLQALSPDGPPSKLAAYETLSEADHSRRLVRGAAPLKTAANWIEKEVSSIKASYDEEIRCLDAQVQDLYSKLKEHQAYEMEMRKQLEDYTKSFYRMAKESWSVSPELGQLRRELDRALGDVNVLQDELMKERKVSRVRHVKLVEDLTRALEAREVALLALKRLEKHCDERGLDTKNLGVFEELQRETIRSAAAEQVLESPAPYSPQLQQQQVSPGTQQQLAMSNIIRGLIEADHDLLEAERRGSRGRKRAEAGSSNPKRAVSASHTGLGLATPQQSSTPIASIQGREQLQMSAARGAGAGVEGHLTETFLTNRVHTFEATSSTTVNASGKRSSNAMPSNIPSFQSRPQTQGQGQGQGGYSLPTAANSSGGSFLRVSRARDPSAR